MTDATEVDTAAIRARLEAATPGPWRVDEIARVWADRDPARWDAFHIAACHDAVGRASDDDEANAEFIAHARTDVERLLAALDEARAEVTRLSGPFPCAEARALAAESALAAVRALRSSWWSRAMAGSPAHQQLGPELDAALASPTTTEETQPQGTERVEWGVRYEGTDDVDRWCCQKCAATDREPGDTVVRRAVTSYPDRVGEWEPVEETQP